MLKQVLYFCSVITYVLGAGDLIVLSHPKSISFKGHEHVDQSTLKEMYSAALGFTIEQSSSWSGMYLMDPFHLAKAIATVVVDGVSDIGVEMGHHYPLRTNENEEYTWDALQRRILARYPNTDEKLVRVELDQGADAVQNYKIFGDVIGETNVKVKHLKFSTEEDQAFLNQLALLNGVINKLQTGTIKKSENAPDVYWFVLTGLHAVSDLHGDNSSETIEAKELLMHTLSRFREAFKKVYGNDALITIITSDASHTRFTRSLKDTDTEEPPEKQDINLAKIYNPNYPVIFNIILWFGVAMFFALLAICITIGNMDPGRDSIIYRMTSNRMKKDN